MARKKKVEAEVVVESTAPPRPTNISQLSDELQLSFSLSQETHRQNGWMYFGLEEETLKANLSTGEIEEA